MLCNTKKVQKNQAGMNLTPLPSLNCHVVCQLDTRLCCAKTDEPTVSRSEGQTRVAPKEPSDVAQFPHGQEQFLRVSPLITMPFCVIRKWVICVKWLNRM